MIDASQATLREFVYLDEASVQSLLASLVGALPAEVTSLSARNLEAELSAKVGSSIPLTPSVEFASRFKGASSSSTQTLSRAVAESIFKNLYDRIGDRMVWPARDSVKQPIPLERGALIEVEVELAPDPIYAFDSTMNLLTELATDYPRMASDPATAAVLEEAGPLLKVLERLMAGLIPLRAPALDLYAGELAGTAVAGPRAFFEERDLRCRPISIVGVTEQDKYWRDVRRVLFAQHRFKLLGRINRPGVHETWNAVKVTEIMREIAPQFPDAIAKVGHAGYAAPVNIPQEQNRSALEQALVEFAVRAGGDDARSRREEVEAFAHTLRDSAIGLTAQRQAFGRMEGWLLEQGIVTRPIANARELRTAARATAGLRAEPKVTSIADLRPPDPTPEPEPGALIDVEIVAIYW